MSKGTVIKNDMVNYNKSKNLLSELTDNVWVMKTDIELFIIIGLVERK
jgi:hypothetical protein